MFLNISNIVYFVGSRQLIGVKSSFTFTGSFAFFGLDPDTHYEVRNSYMYCRVAYFLQKSPPPSLVPPF